MKKNLKYRFIIFSVLFFTILLFTFAASEMSGKNKNVKGGRELAQRRSKARHFYLSGASFEAMDKPDIATELYKRAYEIDSTYSEAAFQLGIRKLGLITDTVGLKEEIRGARNLVEQFRKRYPGDLFSNLLYARLMYRVDEKDTYREVLESLRVENPSNSDIVHMLSSAYLENKDYEKALKALEDYGRAEGEDFELTVAKASILFETGDTVGAFQTIDRMALKEPSNPQYNLFKSQLYLYANQPDSALSTAQKAELMVDPAEGGAIKLQLADIYLSMGDSINYDAKTYEALLAEDIDFETKNAILTSYLQGIISDNSDRARGDKLFAGLLRQYPHEASLRELSSRYNASKRDFEKAEEDIDYALDLDHTNEKYWTLAMMYAISGDNKKRVEEVYDKAMKNLPDISTEFSLLAGNAFVMNDEPQKAIEIYQKCLQKNFPGQDLYNRIDLNQLSSYLRSDNINDLIGIYRQAGDAFHELKDREHSFMNYENAMTLDDNDALLLNNYAYFLIESDEELTEEEMEKAEEMSKKSLALEPENKIYLDTRAWILFKKGDYEAAKEVIESIINTPDGPLPVENNGEYYSHYGDILYMNNLKEEAREAWKKALEATPNDETLKIKVKTGEITSPKRSK